MRGTDTLEAPRPQAAERARRRGMSLSQVWTAAALLFPLAVLAVAPLAAIDLAYQVRSGDVMLSTHHVLRTDPFTFTAMGHPWLNQQWGAELLLALSWRAGGWLGLVLLRGVLCSAVLGFLLLSCRAAGASRRVAAWLTLASGTLLLIPGAFQLRAQLFGVLCFAAVLWLVAERRQHPGWLWWTVPVIAAWSNFHGSFFLGPVLVGLGWAWDLVDRDPGARRTLLAGLAGLGATVLTPFGPRVWGYVVDISTNPLIRRFAEEWQRPSLDTYVGASFLVSAALVAGYLARRPGPIPWPALLSLAVFLGLGLTSERGTVWWALAMPVVVAGLPRRERASGERADPVSPLNAGVVAMLALVTVASLARWLPHAGPEQPVRLVTFAPPGITRELRAITAPGDRLFAAQEWGSWFELALPRNPVMVDSRYEVIPRAAWEQYLDASEGREGWQAVLDRWDVRVVVLARDQQPALIERIGKDPGWSLAYGDADGSIFVRS